MRYIDIISYMFSVKLLCATKLFCEPTFGDHAVDEPAFCQHYFRRCELSLNLTLCEMSFGETLFCE